MGRALHDTALEWESSGRTIDPIEHFVTAYDNEVADEREKQPNLDMWVIPPPGKYVLAAIKNYRERGVKQLETYIPRCLDSPWEITCLEREFEIELGDVLVKGQVDRILVFPADETYLIEDLKSGNLKGEDDIRQLGFYAMVARELWDIPVWEGRYWFTKMDRGSEPKDLSRYDKNFWIQEFESLDRGINEGIFLANPGEHCTLCDVRPWCNQMGYLKVGEEL